MTGISVSAFAASAHLAGEGNLTVYVAAPFFGYLVCSSIELTPVLNGTLVIDPAVVGEPQLDVVVDANLTIVPAVAATPEIEVVSGTPAVSVEVLGTPDMKECD